MFKLTIAFNSLAELSSFVKKMGDEVIGGNIEHVQPVTKESVPVATEEVAAPKKKSSRSTKVTMEAPSHDLAPKFDAEPIGGSPFPSAPTSFTPGIAAAPVHAEPVHTPAPTTVQPAPSITPVAQTQVDPVRQQWNAACGQLIQALEKTGLSQVDCDQIIQGAFASAGCAPTRITMLTDAQIQLFYPALDQAVKQVAAGLTASKY